MYPIKKPIKIDEPQILMTLQDFNYELKDRHSQSEYDCNPIMPIVALYLLHI